MYDENMKYLHAVLNFNAIFLNCRVTLCIHHMYCNYYTPYTLTMQICVYE